jgi:hypothetical protein
MEKVMTRRPVVAGAVMVMLLAANYIQAEVCRIVNGSFEDDGRITDFTVKEPNGWDVNLPAGKFAGYVYRDWVTHGIYNLTLYSNRANFASGDIATVSQQVNLTAVNEVTFDLKLATDGSNWDPNKCTAVVLIDGDVVWESNSIGPDVRGEYLDQVYTVDDKYKDGQPHLLSFGMRVNVAEKLWERYYTYWDSIGCTLYCGGGGLLTGDFNRDCFVDANDLEIIAQLWLEEVKPDEKCNLFHGDDFAGSGAIDFRDFAVFADRWAGGIDDIRAFAEKWLDIVGINDQYNLFHLDDVEPEGVINFFDLATFADTWLGSSYPENP